MYAENPKQFNKTYRIQIAHTEQEIDTIIWMGVFCGDKTGFVRPGHKCKALYESRQFGLIWHWYQSMYSYVCTLIYHHDLILFCLASHK